MLHNKQSLLLLTRRANFPSQVKTCPHTKVAEVSPGEGWSNGES